MSRVRGLIGWWIVYGIVCTVAAQDDGRLATKEFGSNGWVRTDLGGRDVVSDLCIQADGKVVVVGQTFGDFALVRYGKDGSIDATFGAGGIVTTDFGGTDSARAVAIQADGKIVAAGFSGALPAVARYLTTGSLDPGFGDSGRLLGTPLLDPRAAGVAIHADGSVVTVGGGSLSNSWQLRRYDTAGTLDRTFGMDGRVVTTVGDFGGELPSGSAPRILADGRIVAVGGARLPDPPFPAQDVGGLVARYLPDGALDFSLNATGILMRGPTRAAALTLADDDKIIVGGGRGGSVLGQDGDFRVVSIFPNGLVDWVATTRFGSRGLAAAWVNDVAVQSDGRIVAVGSVWPSVFDDQSSGPMDVGLARYFADGSEDTSFDGNGRNRVDLGPDSSGEAIAIRFDRIFVAATIGDSLDLDFALAKFVATGRDGLPEVRQYLTTVDCGEDIEVATSPGSCSAQVQYPPPVLSDPGSATCDAPSGSLFHQGSTPVTCTSVVGDGQQNQQRSASCALQVSVVDDEAPRPVCSPLVVDADADRCSAAPNIYIRATDNCGLVSPPIISPLSGTFGLGTSVYSATVGDPSGNSSACSSTVTVVDGTAPEITLVGPEEVILECGVETYQEQGATLFDACDAAAQVTVGGDVVNTTRPGQYTVLYRATDASGNTASPTDRSVKVRDTTAPTIATLEVTPAELWPPSRKLVPVAIEAEVSDLCDPSATCRIASVSSNEAGGGSKGPDWVITGDLTVDLRASRESRGDGRTYTIEVECLDEDGNLSSKATQVRVPKSAKEIPRGVSVGRR